MTSSLETDSIYMGAPIPAIDRLLDERPELTPEQLVAAYNHAWPRAMALCTQQTVKGGRYDSWEVNSYSDARGYYTPKGELVHVRVCLSRTKHRANDRVGFLLEGSDGYPMNEGPLIELSPFNLQAHPNTLLGHQDDRWNDPEDLVSLSRVLNMFDGQGDLPMQNEGTR